MIAVRGRIIKEAQTDSGIGGTELGVSEYAAVLIVRSTPGISNTVIESDYAQKIPIFYYRLKTRRQQKGPNQAPFNSSFSESKGGCCRTKGAKPPSDAVQFEHWLHYDVTFLAFFRSNTSKLYLCCRQHFHYFSLFLNFYWRPSFYSIINFRWSFLSHPSFNRRRPSFSSRRL